MMSRSKRILTDPCGKSPNILHWLSNREADWHWEQWRYTRHYDVVVDIRESERRVKRRQLTQVINAVLSSRDGLYYYQVLLLLWPGDLESMPSSCCCCVML
jgi:hypothetical protein